MHFKWSASHVVNENHSPAASHLYEHHSQIQGCRSMMLLSASVEGKDPIFHLILCLFTLLWVKVSFLTITEGESRCCVTIYFDCMMLRHVHFIPHVCGFNTQTMNTLLLWKRLSHPKREGSSFTSTKLVHALTLIGSNLISATLLAHNTWPPSLLKWKKRQILN